MTVSLNTKLDDRSSRLSPELEFENTKSQSGVYIRQRVSLAFLQGVRAGSPSEA